MIMKLYSIKDVVVGHFKNPAQFNNDNECIRAIKVALSSINDLSRQCNDLQMWCLGEFDTETGLITSEVRMVANFIDYVNPQVYQAIQKPDLNVSYSDALGVDEIKKKMSEVNNYGDN